GGGGRAEQLKAPALSTAQCTRSWCSARDLIPQCIPIDLAGAAGRKLAAKMVDVRPFEPLDSSRDPFAQDLLINVRTGPRHNQRMDALAQDRVGDAGGKRSRHRRMLNQDAIEFERRNLGAAATDNVFDAAGKLDTTILTYPRKVPGAKESVRKGGARH